MYSSNFYGTQSSLINNKVIAKELVQVAWILMRAAAVYQIFPYSIADKIVRSFMSAEKHIDIILKQIIPVIDGIRSGSIPDDETTYISMLMKLPVLSDGSIRSATETALRVIRLFSTSNNARKHANSFILYELARRPELVQELREAIMRLGPITSESLQQVPLIDSFIREVLRLKNHTFMLFRVAKKDIILSTGHVVPEGSVLTAAIKDAHQDPEMTPMFSDVPLDQFDPYRYMKTMNEEEGEGIWGPTKINRPGYYPFGYGMHPCRGRHFAVQEMKFILAEIVTNYNIKIVSKKQVDDRFLFGVISLPPKESLIFERI